MRKHVLAFLTLWLSLMSCHPFSLFRPPSVNLKKIQQESNIGALKDSLIQIAIDEHGIPFIKAVTMNQALYGLGSMHAQERLFQLDMIRHAALGKTTELFGKKTLELDRKLRIISYRLDEQVARLTEEEKLSIESYVAGVNDSAKRRKKRTAEHFLLGISFEELTVRDVIAIARLQAWQLGSDLMAELGRFKIAKSHLPVDEKKEILSAVDDRGTAILGENGPAAIDYPMDFPAYLHSFITKSDENNLLSQTDLASSGASNAWVVEGKLANDGYAMLMNDPHLPHNWPSNFYLAIMSTQEEGVIAGATFVGLPGILIGASKNVSWGVTASMLNTQDAVLITKAPHNPQAYLVDNDAIDFQVWPQQFCLDKKGNCIEQTFLTTIYGPVISREHESLIDGDDLFAVQWTGFSVEEHISLSHGFIELSRTRDAHEAIDVIKTMTLPGVNIVVADKAGNIGYAYAGLVAKRDVTQYPYLPLDGKKSSSLWSFYDANKPAIINPAKGFLVTANQNIYQRYSDPSLAFGKQGAPPYRALRITERINDLLEKNHKLDFKELSSIQLDETSVEARELAPLIGKICLEKFKNSDGSRKEFAEKIWQFDGRYHVNSRSALPYEFFMQEMISEQFLSNESLKNLTKVYQINYAIKNYLFNELKKPNLSLNERVGQACEDAYANLAKKIGSQSWKWRWGRHHYIVRQSPLAKAPLIGGLFKDQRREVGGSISSPLAEAGTPVVHGANLRFLVKMSSPYPQIFLVIDAGNSGTIGDSHAFDQALLWHQGRSIAIETDWEEALKKSTTNFSISVKPALEGSLQ